MSAQPWEGAAGRSIRKPGDRLSSITVEASRRATASVSNSFCALVVASRGVLTRAAVSTGASIDRRCE
jgi:hypothetical protein